MLRRSAPSRLPVLRVCDLELNTVTRAKHRGGRAISLTAKKYALMEYLMRNAVCRLSGGLRPVQPAFGTARAIDSGLLQCARAHREHNRELHAESSIRISRSERRNVFRAAILCVNTLLLKLLVNVVCINRFAAKIFVEIVLFVVGWTIQKFAVVAKRRA